MYTLLWITFKNLIDISTFCFQVWILVGTYTGVATLAVIITVFFVDHLVESNLKKENNTAMRGLSLLLATFKQMKNKNQILLSPITAYIGFKKTFLTAEWSLVRQGHFHHNLIGFKNNMIIQLNFMN